MSRFNIQNISWRLKMGFAVLGLSYFSLGCTRGFSAASENLANSLATSNSPSLVYQLPSSFNGLYIGLSFQNLSLNDWQRMYNIGSTQWGGFCDIVGHDTVYGLNSPTAPTALWGGTAAHTDSIQLIQEGQNDYTRQIVTDNTVPSGVSNKVLQLTVNTAYDPTVGGESSAGEQDNFVAWPDTSRPQGMVYMSKWIWLQPDLPSRGPFTFFLVSETKTDITERFGAGLTARSYTGFGDNTPVWGLMHDGFPNGGYQVYAEDFLSPTSSGQMATGQTYAAPVPLGQWFRVELAWNRNVGGNGWIWMALTVPGSSDPQLQKGVQVFTGTGAFNWNYNGSDPQTQGWNAYNNDEINRIFPFGLYSDLSRSPSSPYSEKITNIEVWNTWPSNATAHPANFN